MDEQTTALATLDTFAVAQFKQADLQEALEENMSGSDIGPFDLDRIKVPASGMTKFVVPTLENPDGEMVDKVSGVILLHQKMRSYWVNQDSAQEGSPPDCVSIGGETGNGNPGGNCAECPFNQFGSADKGEGKACKETKAIYLLKKDGFLPSMVSCPPSSLGNIKKYLLRLTSAGLPYHKVVTDISLKKAQNKEGTAYAQLEFNLSDKIGPEQHSEIVAPYRERFNASMVAAQTRGAAAPF